MKMRIRDLTEDFGTKHWLDQPCTAEACQDCIPGRFSLENSSQCEECEPGAGPCSGGLLKGQFSTWEEDLIQGEKTSLIYFNIPKQRISFRNGDGLSSRIANNRDLQFV
jgi:hypothetical protein